MPTLSAPHRAEDGKTMQNKPFEEVTIRDLRRAVEQERRGSKKAPKKKPRPNWLDEEAAVAIENGNKALDKAVGTNAGKTADVTVRRVGDDIVVDVRGVPLNKAHRALAAIASALE